MAAPYAQKSFCASSGFSFPSWAEMVDLVKQFELTGPSPEPVEAMEETPVPEVDGYAGPQEWRAIWCGPYFSDNIPAANAGGIYLIYVGNYPVFVSSSANIPQALSRHLVFSGRQAIPIDQVGREILGYSKTYHQPLNIKTALLYRGDERISPAENIHCYRRAASAIAHCHAIPCNKLSLVSYEFDPLTLVSGGKSFPLKARIHAPRA